MVHPPLSVEVTRDAVTALGLMNRIDVVFEFELTIDHSKESACIPEME
jgi:hypothetical protein